MDKVKGQRSEVGGLEMTVGCPSLGLPKLPGGFDGVEPVAKMNAQAIFSDVLDLVLNAAKEAPIERQAREMFYRHIIGDISAALASVSPVERVGDCLPKQERLQKSGKGKFNVFSMRVAKTPNVVVFQCVIPNGRILSAEMMNDGHAFMYDGKEDVCEIIFKDKYKGLNWSYPIVRRAMNGLVSKAGKASRNRENRKEGV